MWAFIYKLQECSTITHDNAEGLGEINIFQSPASLGFMTGVAACHIFMTINPSFVLCYAAKSDAVDIKVDFRQMSFSPQL